MTDDPKTTNGPRIKFPCGHIIGVSERSFLDPFRCPICDYVSPCPHRVSETDIIRAATFAERERCIKIIREHLGHICRGTDCAAQILSKIANA